MADTPFEEAVARSRVNRASRWPRRGEANRLEPECWPELNPGFAFEPASRAFTIGSCFARNLEAELARLGFQVPVLDFLDANPAFAETAALSVMNRYTPASILQTLAWSRAIRDRDDQVRVEDVRPFLIATGDDRFIDLMRPGADREMTPEEALHERRLLHGLFRQAFDCPLVVMTLGLIECWWDRQTDLYVEFSPAMRRHPDRFVFRRLDYPAALAQVQGVIDLLRRDADPRIMITTSPVPLSRTFTADDVIVANTYSKSVLRAVAGAVAEANAGVDYFPSYESVMLTRRAEVWQDDLIHVSPLFVAEIMARVTQAYAGVDGGATGDQRRFSELWREGARDEAAALYDAALAGTNGSSPFHVCAAELAAWRGDAAAAREHIDKALAGESEYRPTMLHARFSAAEVLDRLGDPEGARDQRRLIVESMKSRPTYLPWLTLMLRRDRSDAVEWIVAEAVRLFADDSERLMGVANALRGPRPDLALPLLERLLARAPEDVDLLGKAVKALADLGRGGEALPLLERMERLGSTHFQLVRLADRWAKDGRRDEARALLERLAAAHPEAEGLRRRLSRLSAAKLGTG